MRVSCVCYTVPCKVYAIVAVPDDWTPEQIENALERSAAGEKLLMNGSPEWEGEDPTYLSVGNPYEDHVVNVDLDLRETK